MKKNISNKQQYFFNIEEMKKKENEALQILIENIDSPYSMIHPMRKYSRSGRMECSL